MTEKYSAIHPLQSHEWGEFRKKTGIKVIRIYELQITIHKIPHTPWTIGYIPKGPMPTKEMIIELKKIGEKESCIFIQLEPNVILSSHSELARPERNRRVSESNPKVKEMLKQVQHDNLISAAHPLFTKYTFILNLTKSEEDLLKSMHPKTRYNIKVAQKHNVKIVQDNSDKAFETYLKLTQETTKRQGFYAHTQKYHRLMWKTLKVQSSKFKVQSSYDKLTAHLLIAQYQPKIRDQGPTTLAAWILFVLGDTLYYPYGGSSTEHRETMASNLMMWEAIRFGKKLGLKKFDMWGSLGPNPDKKDPWYGFHRFKEGYGGKLVEFIGSYDLVINPFLYEIYNILDKLRWIVLKFKL